jgi:hypothetical protein
VSRIWRIVSIALVMASIGIVLIILGSRNSLMMGFMASPTAVLGFVGALLVAGLIVWFAIKMIQSTRRRVTPDIQVSARAPRAFPR